MNDADLIALSRNILEHHYGTEKRDDTGKRMDGSICWTCVDTEWPCPPARLAQETQIQILAR